MLTLPNSILKALRSNKTSLGDNPAFPPEEEENFITKVVEDTFNELSKRFDTDNLGQLKQELSDNLVECKNIESKNIENLEKLCVKTITDLFEVPNNSINFQTNIIAKIDDTNEQLYPQKTVDYSFDDIEDMNQLQKEVYKRRVLNALVVGAAIFYANKIGNYIKDVFELDSELPSLYKKILEMNTFLMFFERNNLEKNNITNGGKVDVNISDGQTPTIQSQGIIFPILLEETIRGVLELSISHGLPTNIEKAKYVMSKSDFKLAELWDMKLGYSLWCLIEKNLNKFEYHIDDVGVNYFLMELSMLDTDKFNHLLQEIFANTKNAKLLISDIFEQIQHNKESDEFNDFITMQQQNQINDSEFFTSEELLTDNNQ